MNYHLKFKRINHDPEHGHNVAKQYPRYHTKNSLMWIQTYAIVLTFGEYGTKVRWMANLTLRPSC
jgi:hypothetical protein